MNYEQFSKKINNGDYNSKLPYPPYRPDMAERERMKNADRQARDECRADENRLQKVFEADLRKYIENELGMSKPLTDKQYSAIFSKAWEDGHANGYHEVLLEADNLLDIVRNLL